MPDWSERSPYCRVALTLKALKRLAVGAQVIVAWNNPGHYAIVRATYHGCDDAGFVILNQGWGKERIWPAWLGLNTYMGVDGKCWSRTVTVLPENAHKLPEWP